MLKKLFCFHRRKVKATDFESVFYTELACCNCRAVFRYPKNELLLS